MATKIDKKIVGYKVVNSTVPTTATPAPAPAPVLTENIVVLNSVTRQVVTPDMKIYITVHFECGSAKEVFFNLSDLMLYDYFAALAIMMSKSGMNRDVINALTSIGSANGFFFKPVGFSKPRNLGVIAAVAYEILGIIDGVSGAVERVENLNDPDGNTDFPPNATVCPKCQTKAVVLMDGCQTCLECGDSKCG